MLKKEKRMSAITAALSQIDRVAAEGDLAPDPAAPLELETACDPILLPDGKRIYPPCLHGQPIDELAVALLDMQEPAESTFLRLIGPPGAGKSQIARAIAYRLWTGRGREVADRQGAPFYGFVELQPGPSSDEFFFRYDYVPVAGAGGQVALVDSAFVQAMREGWVVMIDEVNTARDVALLSINATLDGRLTLYLAATGETVLAQPGFAVLLAYNRVWSARPTSPTRGTGGSPPRSRSRATGPRSRSSPPTCTSRLRPGRSRTLSRPLPAGCSIRPVRPPTGVGDQRAAEPARLPAGRDVLMPASRITGPPAVFVQQLHRSAAQRGRLDPVFQELSDHWTRVLQRLYPVWALIGPGLSDPGHIEIHSRTVYLDSETLLGSRAAIAAGALEQRAILRCFGVALHETLHAKHTKRWAIDHDIELSESDDPAGRQLAVDRRLLEEPRMEAHGVREFPPDTLRGRFVRHALQAAVTDVILRPSPSR
jgi:hypothetical protein